MKIKQHLFSIVFVLLITAAEALAQRYNIKKDSITFSKVGDDLHVLQGATDDTYVFNNGTFPNIIIYGNGTVTDHVILVDTPWTSSGYETIITLSNVLIQSENSIPIELTYNSSVKMFLASGTSNEVKTTGIWRPGIKVSDEDGLARLTIKGSGKLVAVGGESSAGIGGYVFGNGGIIHVEDCASVWATGGMGGAGIGGGEAKNGGEITLSSNAVVIARGGSGGVSSDGLVIIGGAAGIGGGGLSSDSGYIGGAGGTITLSGNARVTALAGAFASAIGGGENGTTGSSISIHASVKVVAFSDGTRQAIDDDDVVAGNGYVILLNYFESKAAGTTNTLCLRNWTVVTNVLPCMDYKSLALSLCQTNVYHVISNGKIQEHQANINFQVLTPGMTLFNDLADTNSLLYTLSTPVAVPYEWLARQYPGEPETNYEPLANSDGANGCYVWESYVAGLVPTNAASIFTSSIALINGKPFITWSPNYPDRVYTIQGKGQLSDSSWGPTNSASRFFSVNVEKP